MKALILLTFFILVSCGSKIDVSLENSKKSVFTPGSFFIEAKKSGLDFSVQTESINVSEELEFSFIESSSSNNVGATWTSSGGKGTLLILSSGITAKFTATSKGVATIQANYNGVSKQININIGNTPPVLDAISNQAGIMLGSAISQINASDGGDDFDSESEALSYSCYYDQVIDSNVSSLALCSSLTGLSFNTSTGVLDWTSVSGQVGNYEFKIVASDGFDSDEEIFNIEISGNTPPVLDAIADNRILNVGDLLVRNAGDGGDDFDGNSDPITYSCFYDTNEDDVVASVNLCSSLFGATFNTTTGEFRYTPGTTSYGKYEIKIIGSDGFNSDDEIFVVSVIDPNHFVSVWKTTAVNETITLPLRSGFNYSFTVDWGDRSSSTISSSSDVGRIHTYAVPGEYVVTIVGTAEAWYFNNTGDKNKIISVESLGNLGWKNLDSAFMGCINITRFVGGVTTNVTSMTNTFRELTSLTYFDISMLNTSNVTNMYGTFVSLPILSLNLSHFNVSKVISFERMFVGAKMTSLNLSGWSTIAATNFSFMFDGMSFLTSLDVSSFNTSLATTFSAMFRGLSALTNLDLSNFITNNVQDISAMFQGTTNLVSLNISSFNTSNVLYMNDLFYDARSLTSLDLSHFDTSKVTSLARVFQNMYALTSVNVSSFITTQVTSLYNTFAGCRSLSSLDLSNFDTSNVTTMAGLFNDTGALTSLDISTFDTSKVTTFSYMFSKSGLSSLDLSHFNTALVTDMQSMFNYMPNVTTINLLNFNTSNVTIMKDMFSYAANLVSVNLSSFNTSNVTSMFGMFYSCTNIASLDLSHFDTSKVTTMNGMFGGNYYRTFLDISNFNTSNVTDMASMFYNNKGITGTLDLSHFNTSKVTSFNGMFTGTTSLTGINMSGWDTSSAVSMRSMFYSTGLTNVDVSHFNTANVTDMSQMFMSNFNLSSLDVTNFNTSNVLSMRSMFASLYSIVTLDVSNFDTSKVTDMSYMFSTTNSLTAINANGWDISLVTNSSGFASGAAKTFYCDQGGSSGTGSLFGYPCN